MAAHGGGEASREHWNPCGAPEHAHRRAKHPAFPICRAPPGGGNSRDISGDRRAVAERESRTPPGSALALVVPLALAQFVSSFAATNMNVAISAIAADLGTDVAGIQAAITLFTLTMAALMIPGSKLTDIWGRRRCLIAGLLVYGAGALLAASAGGLGMLIVGNSILEGVGSALMIPPVYILITVCFTEARSRARYFGIVSGAGGLGASTGPLIGGLITSTISWRASFLLQILILAVTVILARRIVEPTRDAPPPRFDLAGAVLSAAGVFVLVSGVLLSSKYGWFVAREDFTVGGTVVTPAGGVSPVWLFVGASLPILTAFGTHVHRREKHGKEPLLHPRVLRGRTVGAGLTTQVVQWLVLQGSFFVISVFLQEARGYDAIQSGLMLTPEILGLLLTSAAAERLAKRRPQRTLIISGFAVTAAGVALLIALVREHSSVPSFWPGLLLLGAGLGVMLTSSVTVVQSSTPERDQGDISGISRSLSNLGSSLGTALVGSFLVAAARPSRRPPVRPLHGRPSGDHPARAGRCRSHTPTAAGPAQSRRRRENGR
jgi:MFS family permease